MPGLTNGRSTQISAGVVSAVQVNGPLANNGSGSTSLVDPSAPSTWAVILFVVALVTLFFVL